jgi:hypothetical protein
MRKQEVLDRLGHILSVEKRGENEYFKIHLQMLEDSTMPESKKKDCRNIIEKLAGECGEHAKMVEKLKKTVIGSEEYDL